MIGSLRRTAVVVGVLVCSSLSVRRSVFLSQQVLSELALLDPGAANPIHLSRGVGTESKAVARRFRGSSASEAGDLVRL